MPTQPDEPEESNIPELAVRALTDAHRQARLAGREVVLVQGRQLVRVLASGTVQVLRELAIPRNVERRIKVARS